MYDYLIFNSFITPSVLIVVYYMGVFFLPVLLWIYRKKVRFLYDAYESQNKLKVILFIFGIFLVMQLFWRIMFEMIIGYFDMYNYLHQMAH